VERIVGSELDAPENGGWSILVHGGAGHVPVELRPEHALGCRLATEAGAEVLRAGGTALDAAERAVSVLEDDPRFNAGTGACLTDEGHIELDASLMEGTDLRAGAVGALPPFLHPIAIARAALDDGKHVFYAGEGAVQFAVERGFRPVAEADMITAAVRERWEKLVAAKAPVEGYAGGTVGAVARDARGHVAAATSTGGMFMKRAGRIGDSPILGAGTYADDDAGAGSNTGHGESVMRLCLAKTAIEWMRQGMDARDAATAAIRHMLTRTGGEGGIILVDRRGNLGFARSTASMSWGAAAAGWDEPRSGS